MKETEIQQLVKAGIIPAEGVVFDKFNQIYKNILSENYDSCAEYLTKLWQEYSSGESSNNLNGKVFESLFATILYREKICPLFVQAKIAFIPNIIFDFVLYSKEHGPIALSLKTSLRERYKQADLEAIALKYVHRKAKCFLFTLDEKEANSVNKKIKNFDLLGIDEICLSTSKNFDEMINYFKSLNLLEPGKIEIITSQKVIKNP